MSSISPNDRAIVAVRDALDAIKKRPHRQQMIMGVGSGLIAGYIFSKIGRLAALILGGGLIALQCAVQQDCIHINWRRMRELRSRVLTNGPWLSDAISRLIADNRVFFGSFGGGFLVAIAVC